MAEQNLQQLDQIKGLLRDGSGAFKAVLGRTAANFLPAKGTHVVLMQYVGPKKSLTEEQVAAGFEQTRKALSTEAATFTQTGKLPEEEPHYEIWPLTRKEAQVRGLLPTHVATVWFTVILGCWQDKKGKAAYSPMVSNAFTYESAQVALRAQDSVKH
jgi:hypothetical protein